MHKDEESPASPPNSSLSPGPACQSASGPAPSSPSPPVVPLAIAIVGRPNVGKSTLFNLLARKQLAIVDDTPGVTRDWRETEGLLYDIPVRLIDTAGLEEESPTTLEGRMRRQTDRAIAMADIILFMVDGRAGITPLDEYFARLLRKQNKKVFALVNKSENSRATRTALAEAHALGLGEPVAISAAHAQGIEDIYTLVSAYRDELAATNGDRGEDGHRVNKRSAGEEGDTDTEPFSIENIDELEGMEHYDFAAGSNEKNELESDKALKIAIVGRPNVGKSSLLNAIYGQERVVTGPEAGITRDSIAIEWEFEGRRVRLVDTAGLRKKAKIDNKLESLSARESLRAIRLSQVTVLVLDATLGVQNQDLKIAAMALEEGRALVIALNKWDLTRGEESRLAEIHERLARSLPQVPNIPLITVSALEGRNIIKLLRHISDIYVEWHSRLRTGPLNRWLHEVYARTPPPLVDGRSNKLRYITQIKSKPPTFALWMARPDALPEHYRRFLSNRLRQDFHLNRVPIRILCRTSRNPFSDD